MSTPKIILRLVLSMSAAFFLGVFLLEQYAQRAWLVDPNWYSLEENEDQFVFRCQSFRPISFSKNKKQGTTRILFMGGSPVFGFPERPIGSAPLPPQEERGIVGALRGLLHHHAPEKYEIVNLGVNGGRSADTYTILNRIVQWDFDIVLIYDGNNEFFHVPSSFDPLWWRFALYRFWNVSPQNTPMVSNPVSASPYGSQLHEKAVEQEFSKNLRSIAALTLKHNIRTVVLTQPHNRTTFDPSWSTKGPEFVEISAQLGQLRKKYPQSATVAWDWWRLQREGGVWDEQALTDSVEYDALRLRATSSIQKIIQEAAKNTNMEIIDLHHNIRSLEKESRNIFYDWVHPTPKGANHIAHQIAEHILHTPLELMTHTIPEESIYAWVNISMMWLRSACIRDYNPTFRLQQAQKYADKILALEPDHPLANGIDKVISNWSNSKSVLEPKLRTIFKQPGSCLAVKVR